MRMVPGACFAVLTWATAALPSDDQQRRAAAIVCRDRMPGVYISRVWRFAVLLLAGGIVACWQREAAALLGQPIG